MADALPALVTMKPKRLCRTVCNSNRVFELPDGVDVGVADVRGDLDEIDVTEVAEEDLM